MNHGTASDSLNRTAFQATVHCLTGCGIGEVLGLVLSTALGWHDLPSILLAIVLAFIFGYGLTIRPLLAGGLPFRSAARLALAADTVSIVVMEVMDNAIVIAVPGAMSRACSTACSEGASRCRWPSRSSSRSRSIAG